MQVEDTSTEERQRRDTLVTAVYDLDPFGPLGGRGRRVDTYFPPLASVAALDAALVVYTQPEYVDQVTAALRAFDVPSLVVGRALESVPRFSEIQELRARQEVRLHPYRDRCHALCHAKLGWLAEQVNANPFGSERFYWIDAGLTHNGLFPTRYLPLTDAARCALFTPRVLDALASGEPSSLRATGEEAAPLVMLGRLPEGREFHGIPLKSHTPFVGAEASPIEYHIVGGLFGGTAAAVRTLDMEYQTVLGRMLQADLLGTEENVLSILYQRDRARAQLLTFTTWHPEDSEHFSVEPDDVSFYRIFERLAGRSGPDGALPADAWYPRAANGLHWHEIDGTFMLSCAGDDRTHVVNHVGVILLELSNGRHSMAEMVAILQQVFNLESPPDAEVRAFLERALREGLLA